MVAAASVTAYDLADTAQAKRARTSQSPRRINGVPVYEQEFWTSKQRHANPLHEVSYRGCFKPLGFQRAQFSRLVGDRGRYRGDRGRRS